MHSSIPFPSVDDRARRIAAVADESDEHLMDLHAAAVRGVRFNFVRRLVDPKPDDHYWRIADRIARLGWHIVIYFEPADLSARGNCSHRCRSTSSSTTSAVLTSLTARGAPYDDVVPFASTVVRDLPDRVLWGTDWPHPTSRAICPTTECSSTSSPHRARQHHPIAALGRQPDAAVLGSASSAR